MTQDGPSEPTSWDEGNESQAGAPNTPETDPFAGTDAQPQMAGPEPASPAQQPGDDLAANPRPAAGYPAYPQAPGQQPGWPPSPAPGWPPPPAQGYGYPQTQTPGWPPAPAPGWPPSPAQGYGYPQTPAWPPAPAPGYGYPSQPAPGYAYPTNPWATGRVQLGPAPGLEWASIGGRLGAIAIDAGILFVALIIAGLLANAFGIDYVRGVSVYSTGATAVSLIGFTFCVAYFPTSWWAFQGTLGQRALGIRVVRARDGDSLGVGETTIRYLLFAICVVTFIPGLIAAALASDNPTKRTWWDEASGSVVVKRY